MSDILPPLDCSLNLSEIIDLHITHENRGAAFAFPSPDGAGITEISHFEFSRAAHRVAHILRPQRRGPEGQVLAIAALTDVLIYQTIVAGCIKAGIVPFPISHRNSAAAVFHLLSTTGAHRMLTTNSSLARLVAAVSAESSAKSPPYELSIEEIPLLGKIFPHLGRETKEDDFTPYLSPATRTALDDVAMYLHSSGSTGFPKSIPETHRNLIHYLDLDGLRALAELAPRLAVAPLPAFHMFGTLSQLCHSLLLGGTACIYAPASTATEYVVPAVSTAQNALENAQKNNATGMITVASLILEWQSPEDVAYLKTLSVLAYGGGPLASRVGDSLFNQGVNICSMYGATEFGAPTVLRRTREVDAGEWAWMRFSKGVNVRWQPVGDGTFECQFLTVPDRHQLSVENLPDVKGYSTNDLFERHPAKPDLYRIVGRLDDVIIMANGEKTVPAPMEDVMIASHLIAGVVMFGRERNQIGVLVEPSPDYKVNPKDEHQLAKFRNLIWPVVEEANEHGPAFSRIYKEMIVVADPIKPLIRAAKGTVIKKASLVLYKDEIETLYDTIEASGNAASDIEPPSSWTTRGLEPWLTTHASLVAERDIVRGCDIFDQGFDSLNATFLRHRIVSALKNSTEKKANAAAPKIPQNFVYAYPSIEELAGAIMALVYENSNISTGGKKAIVEAMIAKYSQGFDEAIIQQQVSATGGTVVLLTGSTGGLGSHILEILLGLNSVERVYAFNRSGRTPLPERQKAAFVDRALDVQLLSSKKLVYLEGDTSKSDLGLPADALSTLRDTVTVIIHNAWKLDFNLNLASFEPHVKGTRNLIDLARQARNAGVRFLFTSSVGSAQGWDQKLGPFPEELQFDADVAVGNGYGESKYISERLLAASGLKAISFRIGQVCGSANNGSWSTSDWVPVIVKSSIALESFPSNPSAVVAWIQPEAVSRTIVDAALRAGETPFAMNLVHPRPVPWNTVMSSMASAVQLPLIPFADWVHQLQTHSAHATAQDIEKIPGLKLLDFFNGVLTGQGDTEFSTSKAQAISDSMKFLKPLSGDDVKQWMHYWREKGFISWN
ncbi:putative aminoadipate reductase [Mycena epipterygia]|nr:putative aminoadipate reductase [Mycena epipterygia]